MNKFVVSFAFLALATGAPSSQYSNHFVGGAPVGYATGAYAAGPAVAHGAAVAHPAQVVGQTHQTYAAGPAVVEQRVEYGVVGSQVVQTGAVSVVGGHQYAVAGVEHIPQPARSFISGAPQTLVETRPLALPAIPAPAPYFAALPPAHVSYGPAPADTVTQQRIIAPVRTHTRITPQQTNIIPQINVQNYNVDVPVHVPVAVEREVIITKHVARPYEVAVPRAVAVPAPYNVHPVQEIIETPYVHHATYTTHSATAIATQHATPIHAVVNTPIAVESSHLDSVPVAVAGYGPVAHGYAASAQGYAAAPALAHGFAAPAAAAYGFNGAIQY